MYTKIYAQADVMHTFRMFGVYTVVGYTHVLYYVRASWSSDLHIWTRRLSRENLVYELINFSFT